MSDAFLDANFLLPHDIGSYWLSFTFSSLAQQYGFIPHCALIYCNCYEDFCKHCNVISHLKKIVLL